MPVYNTGLVPADQPQATVQVIQPDDMPSEELMASLDLPPRDFGDFIRAFQFVIYQSQGMSVTKAAEAAGITRRSIYAEKWQSLIAKARRVFVGKLILGVQAASNRVFEKWPELVDGLLKDIQQPGTQLRDKTAAIEFLYMAFIANNNDEKVDDIEQRQYLLTGPSANPLAPITAIQAEAGATVNINLGAEPAQPGEVLDAEVVEVNE